jgi:S-adenosyl-L-methionine hydrolase (adenosine-forming)
MNPRLKIRKKSALRAIIINFDARMKAVITLTSDWGSKDHYTAAVKGAILSRLPDAVVVDVSHHIQHFNLFETAFVIRNCFQNFPEGSIHIIGVNSEASIKSPHSLILYKGHYFIGSDNGIFSLICDDDSPECHELTIHQDSSYFTFPSRDVFAKAACHIAAGKPISEISSPRKEINRMNTFRPSIDDDNIKGMVWYIDSYENIITNISQSLFQKERKGRKFVISLRSVEIDQLSDSYNDTPNGEVLALFGTTGFLEIAVKNGKASGLLGIGINDSVRIEFR